MEDTAEWAKTATPEETKSASARCLYRPQGRQL